MFHIIKSYLKFLWKSKNEHGIHSPFIFHFVTKCFYDKSIYPEYSIIKSYRKSVLENKYFIEVTDFGAGSRVFKSNKRQISKIAKTAGITSKRAFLLFRIVKYFQPQNILEIGTSLGLATSALSLANKNAKIISLEGCANTLSVAKKTFQDSNFKLASPIAPLGSNQISNVEFINTEFSNYLKSESLKSDILNLIYIDGNHSQAATLEYFELLLPTITNNSVWIFDDIHWSADMENAWKIIQNHPKVTVTIDTFQWGIVFFRAEQEKEHFVVRI